MTSRRSFLIGAVSLLAAPAIVKAGVLMPVKPILRPWSMVPITSTEIRLREMKLHLVEKIVNPAYFMAEDGIHIFPFPTAGAIEALRAVDQMLEELRA